MKYILAKWHHNNSEDPILIYSEIDDNRWEHRKVEIFKDNHYGFADHNNEINGSRLGTEPWPDLVKLGTEPEFDITEISKEEFEELWLKTKDQKMAS